MYFIYFHSDFPELGALLSNFSNVASNYHLFQMIHCLKPTKIIILRSACNADESSL